MKPNTALLLIDLQNEDGTSAVVGMDGILQNTKKVLDICRDVGILVIYTRHINRADGIALANREPVDAKGEPLYYHSESSAIEIADLIRPEDGDLIVDKYRYSGFYESNLDLLLKGLGIQHLIVGGVLTDVCVLSTVMDAYYRDYQVSLVEDLCGTTTEGAHMAAMLMMANWIYDLEVYQTDELLKKMDGESYQVWSSEEPDALQFSPDNMRAVFAKLSSTTK